MELLHKLGESKLKWPIGLRKFIYNKTDYKYTKKCGTYYVDTLEIWKGKLLMRSFAYKVPNTLNRPYKMEIQEVCRRLEGKKEILVCQIENKSLSGRRVYFTDSGNWITKKEKSQYYAWYQCDKTNWWFYEYEMFNIEEWIEHLNIPYCGYDSANYKYRIPFFQYVEIYRKYPKIEFLAKCGYGHLITGARYFNFKGKSFEQIFKIPNYWQSYMEELNVSDVLLIRKHKPSSMYELKIIKNCKYQQNTHILKYFDSRMLKYVENYNRCTGFPEREYNDYLRMAEELGYPMNDKKILYPKEGVHVAHDEVQKKYNSMKLEKFTKGIAKTAKKLKKYVYENEELVIMPAQSSDDLIKESVELKHCVRTYAEQVSRGETGILFIRKKCEKEKPYVTLELRGRKVIQVRGKNNNVKNPLEKEVVNFVKNWEKKFHLEGLYSLR